MSRKFAVITYAQADAVSLKSQPQPSFTLDRITVAGVAGFAVTLPLTEDEAHADAEKAGLLFNKTAEALADYNVDIAVAPDLCAASIQNKIEIADGASLFPFFVVKAAQKALKSVGKDFRDCEFLILQDDDDFTELLIDAMHSEVNYLTILSPYRSERLEDKAEAVFYESGLNIRFTKTAKAAAETADVIINAARADDKLDNRFRRGAVYFDLRGGKEALRRLASRRPDMLLADGLKVKYRKETVSLCVLSAVFYLTNNAYRHIVLKQYRPAAAASFSEELKEMRIPVTGFLHPK